MTKTTIADQVAAMAASAADRPPNEIMVAFSDEQAALEAAGLPAGAIVPGSVLPDADLLDPQGATTNLYQLLGDQPAVLVFYRGAWCPYCNITLSTYQRELLPQLARRGVPLIAVSPQAADGTLAMQESNALTFAVLSDPGNRLARSAGVLTAPTAQARFVQSALGVDLTAVNADGATELPSPTTIVLDSTHVVRWVDIHPNYSTRSEPAEILAALDTAVNVPNRRDAGRTIIREMMDAESAEKLLSSAGSGTFGSAVSGFAIDQAFGDIWTRPGLDRKVRSLITMTVMVALRQPHEYAIHMNVGLNNGLTLPEIEEALIQTLPYVGFPAVATALSAAGQLIEERNLDNDSAYGGHRGLL